MVDTVKVAVLENEIQATLLVAILKEQNIPHFIKPYHDAAYDGIFMAGKGWGAIYAPESFKEEILEIIADLQKETD